ncbi:MAG TPA: peptidoglycan recognition family protein [Candidatus Limnocylindria bacterium]|nr:peptidoglycan recognition family protein [Candidatus Limnocylindria bacterium]
MRRLLLRSVLILLILLLSATGLSDGQPRDNEQPDTAVVPLLDPAAMPESAIPVARAATTSRAATTIRFPYVPQSEYLPTHTNYWEGRDGASIDYIVIHYTDISYARTLRAFNIRASDVSAHYVIRGDGHIAQIVHEADTAWHSGNVWYNRHSIGIELELDRVTNPVFTAEQYYAVAALACAISARQGVPLDREHVIGHNEVPGSTHTDPGHTWDWPHFMWLASLCAPPTAATVHASFVSETPYPDIVADDAALVSVVLRNTGTTAWRKGTEQEARLGIPGNSADLAFLSDGWPTPERPAVQQEDIVPPGETATFSFRVKGALPGTFVVPLRGVVDGAAWMDDLGMYTVVTVR